jgi:hypothetical protein
MIKRLYKKALFVLVPVAALSALVEPKKLPLSILIGGVLGLLNLKGLARGVENLVGSSAMRLVIFSILRLFILAAVIVILVAAKVVNIMGLLIGFTIIFALLLAEGLKISKEGS